MKKNFTLFILLGVITVFLFNRCDKSVEPLFDNDIVPQHDIVWESLSDSPWPMNHGNPQSNGRSPNHGPKLGQIKLKIPYYGIESSIALDNNSNIYTTCNYSFHRLSSLNPSGIEIWNNPASGSINTTPLITKDAVIWADASGLYSSGYGGKLNWKYSENCSIRNLGINVGLDGTIYCVTEKHTLKAICPEGKLLWELTDQRFLENGDGAPTFSPDGKTLYIQGNSVSVLAVDVIENKVKWEYGNMELLSSPIVDTQGNIYFIPGAYRDLPTKTLYCLNSKGELSWKFDFNDNMPLFDNVEPTIDYDGNIYFGVTEVYSVSHSGNLRWKYDLKNLAIISPLISDADGNIYIGVASLEGAYEVAIISLNNKGELNWKIDIEDERALGASPAITKNKELIFPTFKAKSIFTIN